MGVELRLEVDPEELAAFILLGGEDVRDEMIPVKEPPTPENVQDFKDRGGVGLDPRGGRAVGIEDRRGRGGQFQLLIRKRKDGGGKACEWQQRGKPSSKGDGGGKSPRRMRKYMLSLRSKKRADARSINTIIRRRKRCHRVPCWSYPKTTSAAKALPSPHTLLDRPNRYPQA
jgi:hypothetical protein